MVKYITVLLVFLISSNIYSEIINSDWPTTIPKSTYYSVKIKQNGLEETVFTHYSEPNLKQGPDGDGVTGILEDRSLSFAMFSFTGDVEITVTKLWGNNASRVEILPKAYGINPIKFDGKSVTFTIKSSNIHPNYIAVNFISDDNFDNDMTGGKDIKNGMMIFADKPETNKPNKTDVGVHVYSNNSTVTQMDNADIIYFPKGDWNLLDKITDSEGNKGRYHIKKNNQKIYLEQGAFVRGSFDGEGKNGIWIYGRGILTGTDYYWHQMVKNGKKIGYINFMGCDDVRLEGVAVVNPCHHTSPTGKNTYIKNWKIIGWASNHDGIRPGTNSLAEGIFIKTSDDLDYARDKHTVRNSVFWPMRNGAFGQLGWNNLGVGLTKYEDLFFINSEWDGAVGKSNVGIIGSVLHQGVNLANDTIQNIYCDGTMSTLSYFTITRDASKPYDANNPGVVKDFLFKNIIIEKFTRPSGTIAKNPIGGFEYNGAKAMIKNIRYVNIVAGNKIITNATASKYFDIDPNTTSNITFEKEGDIYTIDASASSGGTVSPQGQIDVPANTHRTISIVPNDGYKISSVKVDGKDLGRVQHYTFNNVTENHTISAMFEKGEDYFDNSSIDNITDLQASALSPTKVYLSWSDVVGEDGYRVRRKAEGEQAYSNISDVASDVTNFTDTTALPTTTYIYMVRPIVSGVAVALSNLDTVATKSSSTLVIKPYNKDKFSLYPNPVKKKLSIHGFKKEQKYMVIIYNTHGNIVHKMPIVNRSKIKLNAVSKLAKGVYFVEIKQNGKIIYIDKFTKI